MTISDQEFDALVARLGRDAEHRPFAYKLRVFLLALLGYAYVFGILLGIVGILVGVFLIIRTGRGIILLKNVAIPLAFFAWVVGKSLWVKLSPPTGRVLRRNEAPRLVTAIEEICAKLDAPGADVVLLTDDYNAAVSQVPRLGVFGWHRNYLIIGLPLMQALPPDEWRGILAHEFSHLSRAHARFSNWIYRVRKTWFQLMHTLENERQGGGAWLFRRFFHWYAPYFGAYSFVLARRDEFEADRLAASVAGAEAMARGLILSAVRGRVLSEKFWPQMQEQLLTRTSPPEDVHTRMASVLRGELEPTPVTAWVSNELAVQTGSADTHPATRDRIAALGVDVNDILHNGGAPAAALDVTAAEYFLGDLAATVTAELDSQWRQNASTWWLERHEHERAEDARLNDLTKRQASLDDEELWELARLTNARRDASAAEPLFRDVIRRVPNHASALYLLGHALLTRGDEEGVPLIERAMEIDRDAIGPGSRIIAEFLRRQHRAAEAERYEIQASDSDLVQQAAALERESVLRKDVMLPHGLDAGAIDPLVTALAGHPRVKAAWLARKEVKHEVDRPLFVLGLDTGINWRSSFRASGIPMGKGQKDVLVDELARTLPFPGEAFVVPLYENPWLKKKLKKVPGARIFNR